MPLQWLTAFLKRLGWFYVIALAIAGSALIFFAKLADEIIEPSRLLSINRAVLEWLHSIATPGLNNVAIGITQIGGVYGISAIMLVMLIFFYIQKRYLDGLVLLLVMLGGLALTYILKNFFQIPRPDLFVSIMPEGGFSFPSGHSLNSVCLYGYLAALYALDKPGNIFRWLVSALILLIPLAIMWSRLYLGVHWLSDVLAGGSIAMFWVMVCLMLRRQYNAKSKPHL